MSKTDLTLTDIQEYHRRNIARCLTDIDSLSLGKINNYSSRLEIVIGDVDWR